MKIFNLVHFEGCTVQETWSIDRFLPLDWSQIMPQNLALEPLVWHACAVGDSVGSVLQRDHALLLDLAVLGAGVDAVHHDAAAFRVKLTL